MEQNLARRLLATELGNTPSEANRTGDSAYVGEMNLDANMVVILAALSCALIGALGMNSIVRCVLRCSQSPEGAAAATGLKKRDLGQIPVGVYGIGGGDGGNMVNIKGTDCAICLGEFQPGDKLRMLPVCNHGFHVRCIDTWLLSHSSCPNCRHSLLHPPLKVKEIAAVSQPPPASASTQAHVVLLLQSGSQTQIS
ncbi:RING-H2 finger protein ATL74-like [Momordica charantia]|uniref:RING-type E3 ubiquitin transferase n=1 Tax=Momordica charantia TaxID=3673 RepID=A0A6J1DW47_MOMCH|nr:RING-H2 finger protein ATL74-like [Momordica charantia]